MNADLIGLALASTIRPTSLASVYALLSTRRPRSLLATYIVAGFLVSTAVGVLVVGTLHRTLPGEPSPPAWVDVVLGALSLSGAAVPWLRRGTRRGPQHPETPVRTDRLVHATYPLAALAGVVTHLPGLFYLAALNDILAEQNTLLVALLDVLLFNVIWFAAAGGALVLFVLRPDRTRAGLNRVNGWLGRHERVLLSGLFGAVGLYLIAKGVAGLTG
jgi:hypothetical protein